MPRILTTDPHTQTLAPFVFFHIPKTAGSTMRLLIANFFDVERSYPGFNFPDYFPKRLAQADLQSFDLFMGHMRWDAVESIAKHLGKWPRVFSIFRDPVAHANSQIAFVDKLRDAGIDTSTNWAGIVEVLNEDHKHRQRLRVFLTQAFLVAGNDEASAAGPLRSEPSKLLEPEAVDRARQLIDALYEIIASRLKTHIDVGLFEDLRRSVDLFCAIYRMPWCELPTALLNASGARGARTLTDEQKAFGEIWGALYLRFHQLAVEKFEAEYARHLGGVDDVRAHLDDKYRARLLELMPPYDAVQLSASRAWPGAGWAFRESNEHGQHWRRMGSDGRASLVVRLAPATAYIVSAVFHSLPSIEALEAMSVTCGSTELLRGKYRFDGSYLVQHWLLPQHLLDGTGAGEITFAIDPALVGSVAVAALRIEPCPPATDTTTADEPAAREEVAPPPLADGELSAAAAWPGSGWRAPASNAARAVLAYARPGRA